jgi:phospholipase C
VGLGPRVPMLVVSPWTKGGRVCSQLFDHTSQLRFLEEWLVARGKARAAVNCSLVSPWRRTVCGDLTSAFDFANPNSGWPDSVPKSTSYALVSGKPTPQPPAQQTLPRQERCSDPSNTRPACALPYVVSVDGCIGARGQYLLNFRNNGRSGAAFIVYSSVRGDGPWYYAVEAGKSIEAEAWSWNTASYDLSVHGPNGFLRQFKGGTAATKTRPEVRVEYDAATPGLVLYLSNVGGRQACTFTVTDNAYGGAASTHTVGAGATAAASRPLGASFGWYDLTIRSSGDSQFLRRVAGHVETGAASRTDPVIGRTRNA